MDDEREETRFATVEAALSAALATCRSEFPHRAIVLQASGCSCTLGEAALFAAVNGLTVVPMPWPCGTFTFSEVEEAPDA